MINSEIYEKSLFLSNIVNTEGYDENMFDVVYNSIARVEVLSYTRDSNGNNSITEWSILSPAHIRLADEQSLRCRLVNYSKPSLGIEQKEDMRAPILDSQFIISSPRNAARRIKKKSTPTHTSQAIEKLNGIIRNDMKNISQIVNK